MRTTVRWVEASSTTGGTAAIAAASPAGTSASAATIACSAFAVTDTAAPPISSVQGYQAARSPASATTATVETTITPSTINGHAHAWPSPMPARLARSASAVKDSQNAPAAMNTVPTTEVMTAHLRPRHPVTSTPATRMLALPDHSERTHRQAIQARRRARAGGLPRQRFGRRCGRCG